MAAAFHNISQHVLCGESAGVDPKLISDGKVLAAAVIKDVFNMEETVDEDDIEPVTNDRPSQKEISASLDIILRGIECTDEMEERDLQDFLRLHKKFRASFRRSAVQSDITRFFNVKDY